MLATSAISAPSHTYHLACRSVCTSQTLLEMQIMQAIYAIGTATTIVYYSYIYLLVSETYFQRATSLTRASVTCGVMASGVLGQLLV
jgi:Reduced folate carrier